MKVPLIEFRNVTKSFGENIVLNAINLKIYENEITTIIGKSGTGKSVLLKHIIGLMSPDEGSIFFKGRPINGMKSREWDECRMQISYMFQNNALFDSMTVFENIALPLRQTTAFKNQEIEIKVMSRIEQMDLSNVVNEYPSALSGGMQKRVALARALITDPAIVLFDEPTTGQDPVRKNIILSMIARYRKQFGFTAVLISHDLPDIFFVSDRILILWEGKMDFQGSYEELTKLGHPMLHELKESVDNLSEELDWGVSREMLKQRYDLKSDRIKEGL
jgi:phospholipid/cholesterol/gamma-HCH transport system ATP-binding protein